MIDDYSKYTEVYFLRNKSETKGKIKEAMYSVSEKQV